ncbi:MAG TPA: alpha/beta hydrolase-fold protein, partial [Pirellulales bacterium]
MKATLGWIAALLCLAPGMASAGPFGVIDKMRLERANEALDGELHDYTANNGEDRRIQSNALGEKRDMYVYVPPGFRRDRAYPFIIYLHGLNQDEQSFLEVAPLFDEGIRKGILPPCVIAAPDGTINGDPALFGSGSFYINSEAGRFEDWIMKDVWCFCFNRYPLRRERCCHGLVGASMGGFGVYNLAIKYRHDVSIVAGILPALNLRYVNCHGNAQANYNPDCYGLLSSLRPGQPIACLGGILPIHRRALVKPLFPIEPETLEKLAKESPIEMLDRYGVQPGELRMFIGYAGRDDFNL